jgi:hypothetical protein
MNAGDWPIVSSQAGPGFSYSGLTSTTRRLAAER